MFFLMILFYYWNQVIFRIYISIITRILQLIIAQFECSDK